MGYQVFFLTKSERDELDFGKIFRDIFIKNDIKFFEILENNP